MKWTKHAFISARPAITSQITIKLHVPWPYALIIYVWSVKLDLISPLVRRPSDTGAGGSHPLILSEIEAKPVLLNGLLLHPYPLPDI